MSVKLFLCGQWLIHIFIPFCLTRVWLHPKLEGFIFSLEGKENPLFNSAIRSWNNFYKSSLSDSSERKLPSPVTAELRTFCLIV